MTKIINGTSAREIKAAIWEGARQQEIANQFGVTQATVSRIASGSQWYEVPWPDGSHGALPGYRKAQIHNNRAAPRRAIELTRTITQQPGFSFERFLDALSTVQEKQDEEDDRRLIATVTSEAGGSNYFATEQEDKGDVQEDTPPSEISFEIIRSRASQNELVQLAEESKNETLRRAIVLVFSNLPEVDWNTENARRLVGEVVEHLSTNG